VQVDCDERRPVDHIDAAGRWKRKRNGELCRRL
jgi:hypothetical protein